MNQYEMMRLADNMDDDAVEPDELTEEQLALFTTALVKFTEKYRSFYDDVKFFPKEDW